MDELLAAFPEPQRERLWRWLEDPTTVGEHVQVAPPATVFTVEATLGAVQQGLFERFAPLIVERVTARPGPARPARPGSNVRAEDRAGIGSDGAASPPAGSAALPAGPTSPAWRLWPVPPAPSSPPHCPLTHLDIQAGITTFLVRKRVNKRLQRAPFLGSQRLNRHQQAKRLRANFRHFIVRRHLHQIRWQRHIPPQLRDGQTEIVGQPTPKPSRRPTTPGARAGTTPAAGAIRRMWTKSAERGLMIGSLFDFGTEAMRRIWPDASDAERAKQTLWLAEVEQAHRELLAQVETNTAQARHPSLFVSGPRPALLWVCVIAFALQYIGYPAWVAVATLAGWPIPPEPPTNPVLWELTIGMLGLAGFRSYEKSRGGGPCLTRPRAASSS